MGSRHPADGREQASTTTDLVVGGMTCAACVARVEKRLRRLDGVDATVNLATGRARIEHPGSLTPQDLVAAVEAAGYTATLPEPTAPTPASEPERLAEADRARLLLTGALAVPVIALSMVPSWQFRDWQWLCFVLAAPVATWGAWPFHARALRGLRHGAATMDTLVSLGTAASFLWSVYALFLTPAGDPGMRMPFTLIPAQTVPHVYLEAAVGVPLFVLTGRLLEARARRATGSALRALAELAAKEVSVREGGVERRLPVEELKAGTHFLVRPGERVATDGVVVEGGSALDLSLVTGESAPVEVVPGTAVPGGAVNAGGVLVVRATAVGADTQLARVTRLVEEAQAGKARAQRLADAVAAVFVPVVLAIAVTVLGFWLGAGADPQTAVTAAVAVLVVACPCALGLATPTALLAATGRGAQLGILVSGPRALERLRRIDTVVLDKTGTLTTGRMSVEAVTAREEGLDVVEAARLAGAVETASEHPLGRALTAHAHRVCGETPPPVRDFRAEAGHGVTGRVGDRAVSVGRPLDVDGLPEELTQAIAQAEAAGRTAVLLRVDGRPEAVFALGDSLRSGCYRAVEHLRRLGVRPVLATGDRQVTAQAVAAHLRMTEVHAEAGPRDKADLVRELRARGHRVAVIGDGVNDAAALAAADLGIAMGGGTDAAIGAADVTLVRDDVQALADAVRLARRTLGTVRANLVWAFGYNLITLPLAALGLLDPMLAAAAMSVSSLLVVGNSLRLRTWRPVAASRAARPESWER
ncbi:heavy metal translocating P-type ATPase [Streptantibioticus parmotrematis]|nr:cation-translocating P-type ATPase [Streptantibioticus parmotrematis]